MQTSISKHLVTRVYVRELNSGFNMQQSSECWYAVWLVVKATKYLIKNVLISGGTYWIDKK